jgi:serine/threonine-protein kinase
VDPRDLPTRAPGPPDAGRYVFDRAGDGLLLRSDHAEVWIGTDEETGNPVVGKFFTGSPERDAAAHERFRREAVALSHVVHAFVVRMLADRSGDAREPHVVLEYGVRSLSDDVHDEGRGFDGSNARRRTWLLQLAQALAALHRAGFVHRDLKLDNVVVKDDRGETIRLIDFGLVRLPGSALTVDGLKRCGTDGYMSPQQASDFRAAGPADDVYSFGACCYAIATGERLGERVLGPRDAARDEVPAWLRDLLGRCLDHRADSRPADGSALVVALEQALASAAATSADPGQATAPLPQQPVREAPRRAAADEGGRGSRGEVDRVPSIDDWLPRSR